jgi:type I restriction enzyme M protein
MITGQLKSQVDKLWTEFWTGGITNPLSMVEQITFLMFARLLDINESRHENRQQRTGKSFDPIFRSDQQHLRWKNFIKLSGDEMIIVVRDGVFKHFREEIATRSRLADYMKDAQLIIQKPSLLVSAVNMIEALPLTEGDIKGDIYEYLLSKLATAGINGQFRTPRHIIRLMVELLEPKPTETICDPACGTGGFFVSVMQYLLENNTSEQGIITHDDGSKTLIGDKINSDEWKHIRRDMFHGYDFDSTMLRIATMNLMLHRVDEPSIHYQDTLSKSFPERFSGQSSDYFDIILANPPFKGSLDESDVHPSLVGKVKTKKTELLFLSLILRMLKIGGRSATIVPDGVLFGSSKAHTALRQMLMEENQLEAVISLPSGVFKPYAGVSTAILVFTKGGRTDKVFFYGVENDGYSLDDKRNKIAANDLPDVLNHWKGRDAQKDTDRTSKFFAVPASEIKANNYDLSFSRYRETVHAEATYEAPKVILSRLKKLEADIQTDLAELEAMLR